MARPLMTTRKYAWVMACLAMTALAVAIAFVWMGVWTPTQLLVRWAVVAAILGASVWPYVWVRARAERAAPERLPMVYAATTIVGILAYLTALMVLLQGTAVGLHMSGLAWMVPWMFGFSLAASGWARRVGTSKHCPQCEYECGIEEPDRVPVQCPECGCIWLGRMKQGRRVPSRRCVVAGVVILVGGFLIGNPIVYMGWLAPHLPTPVLFGSLYAMPGSLRTAWDILGARPLNEPSIRAMAERVLRFRHRNPWDSGPPRWFEGVMTAGKMPADLVERFYTEGFRAELLVPERVEAGERFAAQLRVTGAAAAATTSAGILFAGYRPGEAGEPVGRKDAAQWVFQLGPVGLSGHRDALPEMLTVDRPGEAQVSVVYWLVYTPSFRDELVWQADGTPAPWKRALWMRRFELRKTITVE